MRGQIVTTNKTESPDQELKKLIGDRVHNNTKLHLLHYWARHQNTKYSSRTLSQILGEDPLGVVESLEELARWGWVQVHRKSIDPKRDPIFGLMVAGDEQRQVIVELSHCSWFELKYRYELRGIRCCHS